MPRSKKRLQLIRRQQSREGDRRAALRSRRALASKVVPAQMGHQARLCWEWGLIEGRAWLCRPECFEYRVEDVSYALSMLPDLHSGTSG